MRHYLKSQLIILLKPYPVYYNDTKAKRQLGLHKEDTGRKTAATS